MNQGIGTNPLDQLPQEQLLLVLVGVVGSGKSTLATAITRSSPNWARVCQDELGDRSACEQMARFHLAQGKSVILDRQNFDRSQRRTWLDIANAFPNVRVAGLVLDTDPNECARRLRTRQDHPTVHSPALALDLLDKFLNLWQTPTFDEGFDWLVFQPVLPDKRELTPEYINGLIQNIVSSPVNARAQEQRNQLRQPPTAPSRLSTVSQSARPPPPVKFPPAVPIGIPPQTAAWANTWTGALPTTVLAAPEGDNGATGAPMPSARLRK